ncbi:hypothetical protein Phum_PHUM109390 [Pediculus humanus corporis]|uniref:Immunoglobulin V-set domain-containing protein n=1 Tax=Pediculus humanus subsp. corporis TaxID=121224 RepID=E0VDB6_PEDHC|nr:uncharacterized protein Phum_PHUM109390 [Pediculus humanus corporis]EEB11372.1 hypothetical protein Phum_PHUM109390 [Pediculus humanus corporis]
MKFSRTELIYDHNATRTSLRIKPLHVTDEALYKCEITYIEVEEGCAVVQFINLITQSKLNFD